MIIWVALSNHLNILEDKHIKHEGDYWGALNSMPPTDSLQEKKLDKGKWEC